MQPDVSPADEEAAADAVASDLLARDYDSLVMVEWVTERGSQPVIWPMKLRRTDNDGSC